MAGTKIMIFAGSTRKESYNKVLARLAANYLEQMAINNTVIDLADYRLPLYDGDDEVELGLPDNAKRLRELALAHDAYIIASPEYNGLLSGVLKNTIDWMTRNEEGNGDLSAFTGKFALLLSAAPGNLGGLRGLTHVRTLLSNIGTHVVPQQLAISGAMNAFNDEGQLVDNTKAELLKDMLTQFTRLLNQVK